MLFVSNLKIFFLIFFTFINEISAAIVRTDSIKVIRVDLNKNINHNSLIVFDVDDVLLSPTDQLLKSHNKFFLDQAFSETLRKSSLMHAEKIWSIAWKDHKAELIDQRIPFFIKELQRKKTHRVIALTKANTGSYGILKNIEIHRAEMLKKLNINFFLTNQKLHNKIFYGRKCKNTSYFPCYYQGIIYTCGLPKEEILDLFLTEYKLNPESLFFIDDQYKNLEQMEMYCQKKGISFYGYHYIKVQNTKKRKFNHKIFNFQRRLLNEKELWLSDKEIEKLQQGLLRDYRKLFFNNQSK